MIFVFIKDITPTIDKHGAFKKIYKNHQRFWFLLGSTIWRLYQKYSLFYFLYS